MLTVVMENPTQYPMLCNVPMSQYASYDYELILTIAVYRMITVIACLYGLFHCAKDIIKTFVKVVSVHLLPK